MKRILLVKMLPRLIKQWADYVVIVDKLVKPVLFQHLTDIVFQMLLQNHFKALHVTEEISSGVTAKEESSALQYIAGYVYKHLRKK